MSYAPFNLTGNSELINSNTSVLGSEPGSGPGPGPSNIPIFEYPMDVNTIYNPIMGTSLDSLCSSNVDHESPQQKILDMKDSLIDVINGKHHEIVMEGEKNSDINELISKVRDCVKQIIPIQEELTIIDDEFQKELASIKEKMNIMDDMIDFLKKRPSNNTSDDPLIENIVRDMNKIGENILKNQTIQEIKEKYAKKKVELQPCLSLISEINQLNHSNICGLCLSKPVDHYINSCGHTACYDCFNKSLKDDTVETLNQRNNGRHNCPFCRKMINSINKLYYL